MTVNQNKVVKIINFQEYATDDNISIISYKNGLIISGYGPKLNVI